MCRKNSGVVADSMHFDNIISAAKPAWINGSTWVSPKELIRATALCTVLLEPVRRCSLGNFVNHVDNHLWVASFVLLRFLAETMQGVAVRIMSTLEGHGIRNANVRVMRQPTDSIKSNCVGLGRHGCWLSRWLDCITHLKRCCASASYSMLTSNGRFGLPLDWRPQDRHDWYFAIPCVTGALHHSRRPNRWANRLLRGRDGIRSLH